MTITSAQWLGIFIAIILIILFALLYCAYKDNKKNNAENININKKLDKIIGPIALLLLLIAGNLFFFVGMISSGNGAIGILIIILILLLTSLVLSIIGVVIGYIKKNDYSVCLLAFGINMLPITIYGGTVVLNSFLKL